MKEKRSREAILAALHSGLIGLKELLCFINRLTPEQIGSIDSNQLAKVFTLNPDQAKMLEQETENVSNLLSDLEKSGRGVVMIWEDRYSGLLREISVPPLALFYKGDFSCMAADSIAIVGSRKPSLGGTKFARKLAYDLAQLGIVVVSGLARGIDTAAHLGALDAGGRTVAVLGSGVDVIYPAENSSLAEEISLNGLILSEQWLGTPPLKHNFPLRNRIISGLCLGTVVIEAGETSGALITANFALEQNREVFAVPCSPLLPQSKGVNMLLKEGATLVESAEDIIREIKFQTISRSQAIQGPGQQELDEIEEGIFGLLSDVPIHIDEIVRASQFEMQQVLTAVFSLESKGLIRAMPGKFYVRE
ncbi:MAG: DNA-processing protein DprA [bacterium]